ncbi:ABC transporter permease [Amycolatopsis samaneae]|uniref:ABC transporter permease n=1 Tax=Amycolatopsis samaneae TaxID=664691 RepID=A0ABW5GA47_9PSEU
MTGNPGRGARTGERVTDQLRQAEELEAEARLAEAHEAAARRPKAGWAPLPRRAGVKTVSPLRTIRTPIPRAWRWVLTVLSLLVPFLAWVVLCASGAAPATFLPSPGAVLSAGLEMLRSGDLVADLGATAGRVLYGFGLAVLVSVPIGIVMGTFVAGQYAFEPVIGLVRYMPASAFIPLMMIWLGIGEPSKIAILFLGTFFFNTLMVADVVRGVPRSLIDVSYTLGARRGEVLRKIVVPHSLPGIIDAIRVNAAAAWNFVVVAELINSTEGLGYRIVRSQRFLQTDRIFAVLVVIGVAGLVIDVALRLVRTRVGRWTA